MMRILFSLCVLAVVFGLSPTREAAAQGTDPAVQARQIHLQGFQLAQQRRCREAIPLFEQSERLVHYPDNHWNIMRCQQQLGQYVDALRALDMYLTSPLISAEDRQEAGRVRQELEAARLAASLPRPQTSAHPQPSATAGPAPQPGEQVTPTSSTSLAGPWALLGSGLAILLTGAVLDVVAFTGSDATSQEQFATLQEYQDWRDGSRSLAIGGDLLIGLGAAVAIGGLIWLILARSRNASSVSNRGSLFSLAAGHSGLALDATIRF
jgi:hypothetical protein